MGSFARFASLNLSCRFNRCSFSLARTMTTSWSMLPLAGLLAHAMEKKPYLVKIHISPALLILTLVRPRARVHQQLPAIRFQQRREAPLANAVIRQHGAEDSDFELFDLMIGRLCDCGRG